MKVPDEVYNKDRLTAILINGCITVGKSYVDSCNDAKGKLNWACSECILGPSDDRGSPIYSPKFFGIVSKRLLDNKFITKSELLTLTLDRIARSI